MIVAADGCRMGGVVVASGWRRVSCCHDCSLRMGQSSAGLGTYWKYYVFVQSSGVE